MILRVHLLKTGFILVSITVGYLAVPSFQTVPPERKRSDLEEFKKEDLASFGLCSKTPLHSERL